MRVPASSSSPPSSKTYELLEHLFLQSPAQQIQELCPHLTKTGGQGKIKTLKPTCIVTYLVVVFIHSDLQVKFKASKIHKGKIRQYLFKETLGVGQ